METTTKEHDGKDHITTHKDASMESMTRGTPPFGAGASDEAIMVFKSKGKQSILEEAQEIIHGERNKDYGHPRDNHRCTATIFRTWYERKYGVSIDFDEFDVCWFHVAEKMSREANLAKRDNLTDIAGYVGNIEMMQEGE